MSAEITDVDVPLAITVWYDYHCPYSRRAVAWLDGLGTDRVVPTYRAFPLEQVNHDPTATTWRIWEQPLDYEHYRERPHRRGLAAFLATEILAATESPDTVRRFREAVYAARFDARADISDPETLFEAAATADRDAGARLREAFTDEGSLEPARRKLAEDWAMARRQWEIFGVPTLQVGDEPPVYVRLERAPEPGAEAIDLLRRLLGLRAAAPYLIEMKRPNLVGSDDD